jgi:hypothetical protein
MDKWCAETIVSLKSENAELKQECNRLRDICDKIALSTVEAKSIREHNIFMLASEGIYSLKNCRNAEVKDER